MQILFTFDSAYKLNSPFDSVYIKYPLQDVFFFLFTDFKICICASE